MFGGLSSPQSPMRSAALMILLLHPDLNAPDQVGGKRRGWFCTASRPEARQWATGLSSPWLCSGSSCLAPELLTSDLNWPGGSIARRSWSRLWN